MYNPDWAVMRENKENEMKKVDQGSVSEGGEQAENGAEKPEPKRGTLLSVWKFLGFKKQIT